MSVAFSVIFRMNDNSSQGLAATPITTVLVAAVRQTILSWLHGFESQTCHFPLFQHLIRKTIIAEEPTESSKYLVLKSRLLWNDTILQYIISSTADTLRCHLAFLGPSSVSLVKHLQEWTWIIAAISSVCYSLSTFTNKSSAQTEWGVFQGDSHLTTECKLLKSLEQMILSIKITLYVNQCSNVLIPPPQM